MRNVSTRRKRTAHLLGLVLPFAGFCATVVLLWDHAVRWSDLAVLGIMYLVCGVGSTTGFHRLLTHRSFATYPAIEYGFAALGSLTLQGSVIDWVADHRKHHAHADRDGDPHSPHLGEGALRSLWHAHVGWLFRDQGRAEKERYAPDLLDDPVMRAIDRAFPAFIALSLAIPFLLGWALTGTVAGGITGLVWGGLARVFLFNQAIFCVNSICHFHGRRRFATGDRSTNVFWLAPLSLGESWHHNHHAFPRSAMHGLRWYEVDPAGLVIRLLARLGLAWNVIEIAPERQRGRLFVDARA
jgi:stearoyl-CoA desaturase (delta-9 desaturase)